MLQENNIAIKLDCQGFLCETYMRNLEETESVFIFESQQNIETVKCPKCQGHVNICGLTNKHLKDVPIWIGIAQELCFHCHRFRCMECGTKFTEEIPFCHPGTRITERAAAWVQSLLRNKLSIRAVQNITGIHWDTVRFLHKEMMTEALKQRAKQRVKEKYRPKYLAVDEFAIHKGHTYATCVMDLETGEALWVGKGRSKADFSKFFAEIDPALLSEVKAVAMDMNASFHILVHQRLPHAQIVYDRYHMQAQFGKDVLGVVRLEQARKHKQRAAELNKSLAARQNEDTKAEKALIREEKKQYSQIKKLRWILLSNGDNLSDKQQEHLSSILSEHSDLAVCYAMKEEMCRLFSLRDPIAADAGWRNWFAAAKESGIPALVRFATLKEQCLDGLIAHASFPISTGKLEGFNNKIKVAKRVGFGFRDDDFFFLLVRFLSLIA